MPLRQVGQAGVVELVDTLDLGSSAARRGGSSPSARTTLSADLLQLGGQGGQKPIRQGPGIVNGRE